MCPSTRAPWARWTLPWRPPRWWWRPWERRCQAAARQPRLYKRRWIKTYVLHIPFGGYCAYFMVIFGDCVLSDLPCLQHFLMKSLSKKVWHGESWVLLCFTLKWPFGSRSCFDPVSNTPRNVQGWRSIQTPIIWCFLFRKNRGTRLGPIPINRRMRVYWAMFLDWWAAVGFKVEVCLKVKGWTYGSKGNCKKRACLLFRGRILPANVTTRYTKNWR